MDYETIRADEKKTEAENRSNVTIKRLFQRIITYEELR